MQNWTIEGLEKRVAIYNRIYFNNEIEKPIFVRWSRHMFNTHSDTLAYCKTCDTHHLIMLNVKLSSASNELMRSELLHEMIHAWQGEYDDAYYDDWKNVEGHGPAFVKKCEELNNKFKLTYNLTRYADKRTINNIDRHNNDVYYVYQMSKHEAVVGEYPLGVFVKFLYDDEVKFLLKKGLLVKYYTQARFSANTQFPILRSKFVCKTDALVTYSRLKCFRGGNFKMFLRDEFGEYYMASDDDFNYEDGVTVNVD